jgi:hypothetical protein
LNIKIGAGEPGCAEIEIVGISSTIKVGSNLAREREHSIKWYRVSLSWFFEFFEIVINHIRLLVALALTAVDFTALNESQNFQKLWILPFFYSSKIALLIQIMLIVYHLKIKILAKFQIVF